jgi:hypothetical protein
MFVQTHFFVSIQTIYLEQKKLDVNAVGIFKEFCLEI